MEKFVYRGHLIAVLPDHDPEKGTWLARVAIDVRSAGVSERVYYTDHMHTYSSEAEAGEASAAFGRHIVDTFIVPSMGEGDPEADSQ